MRASGRLADPTDLPYSEDHLTEPGALAAAIDDLLQRKPHLASRKPVGEIGQGAAPSAGLISPRCCGNEPITMASGLSATFE
jgi:hypothetical protein